jgi:DNA polymerase
VTLEEIAKQIAKTGGGPLATPGVNPVPGEGNPHAEIMFIGEAPGFHENQEGRPFVGQAGKLLRKTLRDNGWEEDEVYITNVVKYRPPANRDPTKEEIEFFRPFLDQQIEVIGPKIIVTLGRYSMYKFLGEGVSISRVHGQARTVIWGDKRIIIFPMFHPAAALRDGMVARKFEDDFKKLRQLVNKAEQLPLV